MTHAQLIDGEGPHDDRVKVQPLDEHPEEISQQQVVEDSHHQLAQTLNNHTDITCHRSTLGQLSLAFFQQGLLSTQI